MGAAPPQVTVTAPEQGVPALTVEDVAGMKVEDLKVAGAFGGMYSAECPREHDRRGEG